MVAGAASSGLRGRAIATTFAAVLKCVKPRYSVAMQNYQIAFPNATEEQRMRWVTESYDHMAFMGVECLVLQKDVRQVNDWVVKTTGREHFERAAQNGKGCILVICHAGNWELGGAWIAQQNFAPLSVIVRHPQDDREKGLVDTLRGRFGMQTLSKHDPMIKIAKRLKKGEFIGVMTDQHGGTDGIMAPFFGRETSTAPGAAVFAMLTGAPLIPAVCIRTAPFRYHAVIHPPIEWEAQASKQETIVKITTQINQEVEKLIALAPGQWLSQHRRFRELYQ